jgi:hypothetical protein
MNFLLAASDLLGAFGSQMATRQPGSQQAMAQIHMSKAFVNMAMLVGVTLGTLLVLSALGYLDQKRGLGWKVGMTYGVLGLVGTAALTALSPFGFTLATIVSLFYPAFTLFLLLTVFRQDFQR